MTIQERLTTTNTFLHSLLRMGLCTKGAYYHAKGNVVLLLLDLAHIRDPYAE